MPVYFRGESGFQYHATLQLKDLPLPKRIAAILCFVLWIPFAVLLVIPGKMPLGIIGLIASTFVYVPAAILYVANPPGRLKTVPLILIAVGVLGEVGYCFVSWYFHQYGFTKNVLILLCCTVLFLAFFIPGICMLYAGIRRTKFRNTYSLTVMAKVIGYADTKTGDRVPVLEYEAGGMVLQEQLDRRSMKTAFGSNELPELGNEIEMYVKPGEPQYFAVSRPEGGMLLLSGIVFAVTGLFSVAVGVILHNAL